MQTAHPLIALRRLRFDGVSRETVAFTCVLCFDGAPVADVVSDGDGSAPFFLALDRAGLERAEAAADDLSTLVLEAATVQWNEGAACAAA
ncbi:MAG: hypothetical protein CMM84_05240 [Rhodothermaceae bacterium]|nr:hypothetical protein [Rhodothermaceae bacterium]MBC14965.1 hypothetical protein [Rhodothermaceae bacterium]